MTTSRRYRVHKHGARGRRPRTLRPRDRGLELLPESRWRRVVGRRAHLEAGRGQPLSAFPGGGRAAPGDASARDRDAAAKAADLGSNFVVLATPRGRLVTLELADATQARELVAAVNARGGAAFS